MDIVFFDASVLFKSAVTRFLFGAAQAGDFRAVWSEAVVEEARRNLLGKGRHNAIVALEQSLALIRDPMVAPAPIQVVKAMTRTHSKDRHVLGAAMVATILVTDNPRDFDTADARALGVAVATSDELATSIALRNPFALLRAVQRTPAARFQRYVELLTEELPSTMAIVGPMLRDE